MIIVQCGYDSGNKDHNSVRITEWSSVYDDMDYLCQ